MKSRYALSYLLILASAAALAQINSVPVVNQPLSPSSAAPGSAAFTLTLQGTGFVAGTIVNWNGSPRATTFVSSSVVNAAITAADVAKVGTATVTAVNPTPGGGVSNPALFPVQEPFSSVSTAIDSNFSAGGSAVIAADINHDGRMDALIGQVSANTGAILYHEGDGRGNFASPVTSNSTIPVGFMIGGDLNGDGNLDLVVSGNTYEDPAAVFLGDGHGHFRQLKAPKSFSFEIPLALADLNGDGKLDLVTFTNAASNDSYLSIFLGNGDGTFTLDSAAQINNIYGYFSVGIGDFNGDGILDLATTVPAGPNASGQVQVYMGNGDGSFRQGSFYTTYAESVTAADVNGDGKLDLIAGDYQYGLCVLLGNGDGTFTPGDCAGGGPYGAMHVVDVNGDGKPDIVTQSTINFDESQAIAVFLGNGDGSFQSPLYLPYSVSSTAGSLGSLGLGDFNNDGKIDFLYSFNSFNTPNVEVLLQTPANLVPIVLSQFRSSVGKTSVPQKVTLTNIGNSNLKVSSISLTGANSSEFDQSNNCGAGLTPGKSCVIKVTFTPTADGSAQAALSVAYQGIGSPQTIALDGFAID